MLLSILLCLNMRKFKFINPPWIQNQQLIFLLVLNYLRADRQIDRQTRCLKGDHSQKVMQRVEVQSQRKKSMRCRLHVKKYGKIDLKHLLQFPDQPSPILGSTENTTFVHLPKKSKYLKADFFVISSNIVLASEWTTSWNQFVL